MTHLHDQGSSGSARFDFSVHDPEGQLTALVEVKLRLGTDSDWATQLRQNVLSHGRIPPSSLFVIVVPERLYIWQAGAPPDARPTHEINAQPVFAPYFQRINVPPEKIGPMAFELLVTWWLEDVARGDLALPNLELSRSGFTDAVEGGRIRYEAGV